MGKFEQVIVLEVESAKDKNQETEGGKYRRDSPWLVEAFKNKGVKSSIIFITRQDTADTLSQKYPKTAFLGRVNPMDYKELSLHEYMELLQALKNKGLLLGPEADHMERLGSKMILYDLRDTTMGIEGVFLHKLADIEKNEGEIDKIIPPKGPPRVLKMLKGSTGLGVWKLENKGDDTILLTDAYTQKSEEIKRKEVLPRFLSLSKEDAISMPFLPLIKDGEFRFLLSRNKLLEIVHKKPVDSTAFTATLRSGAIYTIYNPKDHPKLAADVEKWTHDIKKVLKLEDVPYWWSVDCIEDEVKEIGSNDLASCNPGKRLILSEINCSCLGMVADTSAEAKQKGMRFANMIADIVLGN